MTWSGPAPADTGHRAQDAAVTTPHNVSPQSTGAAVREARQRELGALVRQVIDGDAPPLGRLQAAVRRGRKLIAAGGQRVALIVSLTAAEAAGVACRDAEDVIGGALRGAR